MRFVNGTYEGSTPSSSYSCQLRFDFDDDVRQGNDLVSGDLFEGAKVDPGRFQFSFVSSNALTVSPDGQQLETCLLVVGPQTGAWTAKGYLTCTRQQNGNLLCQLLLFENSSDPLAYVKSNDPSSKPYGAFSLLLEYRYPAFRLVRYQLDLFGDPTEMAGVASLFGEVVTNLSNAGISLVGDQTGRTEQDDPERVWDRAALFNAMRKSDLFSTAGALSSSGWRMYLLVIPRFPNADDAGWMFDEEGYTFDDGVVVAPRQAAAISWRAHGAPGGTNFSRDVIRTFTHEIGHTFDLLHPFDRTPPRFDSASFMNYPQNYQGASGSGESFYWEAYHKRFDPDEVVSMRHGHMQAVIMGGAALGTGGHDSTRRAVPLAIHRPTTSGGLRLQLRFSPKGRPALFEFGEPVRVEAKLTNTSGEARVVADVLDPAHRQTIYLIRRPGGQVVRFRPLLTRCNPKRAVVLQPEQRPSLYENVPLGYGAEHHYFTEPGRYQIQAVYTATTPPVHSNLLDVWVRCPTRETEDLIVPTFNREVAAYLAMWGNPELSGAKDALRNVLDQVKHGSRRGRRLSSAERSAVAAARPLAHEFARCAFLENLRAHPTFRPGDGGVHPAFYVIPPKPDEALAELRTNFGLETNEDLAGEWDKLFGWLPNILFGLLGANLVAALRTTQEQIAAARVAQTMTGRLDRQGIPNKAKEKYGRRYEINWQGEANPPPSS